MLSKRTVLISLAAFTAMVVVFIATFDFGDDQRTSTPNVIVRSPKKPATVTPPPAARVEATPAPSETEDVVVAEPEPPKEVTYEEAETAFFEKRYNDAVRIVNTYSRKLLGQLYCNWAGVEKAEYFEVAEEAQAVPKVDFSGG